MMTVDDRLCRIFSPQLVLFGFLFSLGTIAPPVLAQSIEPATDGTRTTVTPQGDRLDIGGGRVSEDGRNLFHSFEEFGLSEGQIANFLANPNLENILGRVVGGDASYINGVLQVSGGDANLFLLNPAGIVFGPSAGLNVPADFTATTATGIGFENGGRFDVFGENSGLNALGSPNLLEFVAANPGAIVNEGNLSVAAGSNLNLIGGVVVNTGSLQAADGHISVMAVEGESLVRLSAIGNVLSLEVPGDGFGLGRKVISLNPLWVPQLLAGGEALGHASRLTVNPDGTVSLVGSSFDLDLQPGDAIVSGTVDASDFNPAAASSSIQILGNRVGAIDATLNASGINGGGNIFLGGGFQGNDTIPNASRTFVDENTSIFADAIDFGDGGRVIVWSDETTTFYGTVNARGGAFIQPGTTSDGGFVEISGKQRLVFRGSVDVSAPQGQLGTILFDPDNADLDDMPDFPGEDDDSLGGGDDDSPNMDDDSLGGGDDFPNMDDDSLGGGDDDGDDDSLGGGDDSPNMDDDSLGGGDDGGDDDSLGGGDDDFPNMDDDSLGGGDDDFPNMDDDSLGGGDDDSPNMDDDSLGGGGDDSPNMDDDSLGGGGDDSPNMDDDSLGGGGDDSPNMDDDSLGGGDDSPNMDDDSLGGGGDDFPDRDFPGRDRDDLDDSDNPFDDPDDDEPTLTPDDMDNLNGDVVISATNDINIDEPLIESVSIELRAGRSININADIDTSSGDGDITLFANNPEAAAGERNPGAANIIQAPGTILDAGRGNIFIEIGSAGEVGNVRIGNLQTRGDVDIFANGGDILRSDANSRIAASTAIFDTSGAIGTAAEPLRIDIVDFFSPPADGVRVFYDNLRNSNTTTDLVQNDISSTEDADLNTPNDSPPDSQAPELAGDDVLEDSGEFDGDSDDFSSDPDDFSSDSDDFSSDSDGDLSDSDDDSSESEGDFDADDLPGEFDGGFYETGSIDVESVTVLDRNRSSEFSAFVGDELTSELSASPREALAAIAEQTGNRSAVVYVSLLPEEIDLIVFTADGVPVRKVVPNVSRDEVLQTAQNLRRRLTNPRHRNSNRYRPSAQQLYQWLITPLQETLEETQIDTLLFSMDEGLRTLPVAALHDGEAFLVENYSLSLIPSMSLVDPRYRSLQNTQALGMGASEFSNFPPLPAVPVELATITEEIWQGSAFINEDFTRENLIAQRQRYPYPIVHLATHGEFQPGDPSNSYIQLWDEKLGLDELRDLGWNDPPVELLVLSACRTAVGSTEAELGFAGLAIAAGVKSALASLWYVSDEGTLALMTEFYSYLGETKIKAEALRQAQIAMIRGDVRLESGELRGSGVRGNIPLPPELAALGNTDLSHPYYWSGFTTIGSPW
ncbi:MAG: CHAT domain-containing protein [Cyanobacteriota bacterium]|nr:CHAT domain-containing protein [Cyanobacteriota bacterium]